MNIRERGLNDLKIPVEIEVGDIVRLRKPHPCGSYEWQVVSMGADVNLKCLKCQRRVALARDVFNRRVKNVIAKGRHFPSKKEQPA